MASTFSATHQEAREVLAPKLCLTSTTGRSRHGRPKALDKTVLAAFPNMWSLTSFIVNWASIDLQPHSLESSLPEWVTRSCFRGRHPGREPQLPGGWVWVWYLQGGAPLRWGRGGAWSCPGCKPFLTCLVPIQLEACKSANSEVHRVEWNCFSTLKMYFCFEFPESYGKFPLAFYFTYVSVHESVVFSSFISPSPSSPQLLSMSLSSVSASPLLLCK